MRRLRHFTQLVWKDTSKLGCGVAKCQNDQYFVCRYGVKQGNWNADDQGALQGTCRLKNRTGEQRHTAEM